MKPQPAADYDAREKQSTGSTNKLPAEVEFRKISIEYICNIVVNCIIMRFMYNNFIFIDLFAGIGGVRRSFESVGGNCVYTSEIDTSALKTYRANFSCEHKIDGGDIVNSGGFGARSDGATPICNRRATSDDVTNFSSIDYIVSPSKV